MDNGAAAARGFFERHRGALTSRDALGWWMAYAAAEPAEVRAAAAYALGESRRPLAAPILARLLQDPDGSVRRSAAEAWGGLRPPPADNRPLLAATKDPDGWVRAAACAALGQVEAAPASPWLVERLADENGLVRAAAATALARVDPARARRELEALLSDPNGNVRRAVRHALQSARMAAPTPQR